MKPIKILSLIVISGCVTITPNPPPPAAPEISWMMTWGSDLGESGNNKPRSPWASRLTAWRPGWVQLNLFIGDCCTMQNGLLVCDFSKFDTALASNKIWMAPYGTKVKTCMDWGSYITGSWNHNYTHFTESTNTGSNISLHVRPQWFWSIAPIPQDRTGGAGPGSDIYDAQVPVASQIISNLIVHEGPGKIAALGIAWEPDWGTNYSIPEAMIASSVVGVARANGVMLCEGEFGMPVANVYQTWAGSNYYDAIAFHVAEWANSPYSWASGAMDYGGAANNKGLRYDQVFDAIGALGKPILLDLLELPYACDAYTNSIFADRFVKGILMLRKNGATGIFPFNYEGSIPCAPGFQLGQGECAYIRTNGVDTGKLTPVGLAIQNMEQLIGNNNCSTSSVQYPYYYYRFGTNVFVWIAETRPTTGMVLSGWSSPPVFARDGSSAPTNTLGSSPVVLSGDGSISLR